MNKHWRYLSYVARHKWFVLVAGRRLHVGLWQLLTHDLSKFGRAEWGPYAEFFYGYNGGSWYEVKRLARENPTHCLPVGRLMIRERAFDGAWLHHQHANPHHWQHWVLREDSGKVKTLLMPDRYIREMVADWMGAGRAITGKWEVGAWYAKNREKIELEPNVRDYVERLIALVSA